MIPSPQKTLILSPAIHDKTKLSPLASLYIEVNTPDMKKESKLRHSILENSSFSHAMESSSKASPKLSTIKPAVTAPWIDTSENITLKSSPLMIADAIPSRQDSNISAATASGESPSLQISSSLVLCLCGNPCQIIGENTHLPQCNECIEKNLKQKQSGYLYEKEGKALKRYWFVLSGPYLYSKIFVRNSFIGYENQSSKQALNIYSLLRGFVKEELEELVQKRIVIYPLCIYCGNSKVTIYSIKREIKDAWVAAFKEALNYSRLTMFYDVQVNFYSK